MPDRSAPTLPVHPVAGATVERVRPAGATRSVRHGGDAAAALAWSALSYRLPATRSRVRVSIWRRLKQVGALNLGAGSWAVAHDEDGRSGLDAVVDLIVDAGGVHVAREVGDSTPEDELLLRRLAGACDHLWDAFFNDCDALLDRHASGLTAADAVAALEVVRAGYLQVRARDLLFGDAGRRAARKLSDLYRLLGDDLGAAAVDPWPVGRGPHRAVEASSVIGRARRDGTVAYVIPVTPMPTVRTERAFADFEATVYLPDPDRPPLEHGAFTFVGRPGGRDAALDALARRLDLFAQSRS